jgi:hypothetical protein
MMMICMKCGHGKDWHCEVEYSDGYNWECGFEDCQCSTPTANPFAENSVANRPRHDRPRRVAR